MDLCDDRSVCLPATEVSASVAPESSRLTSRKAQSGSSRLLLATHRVPPLACRSTARRAHEIADSGAVVNLDQPRITSSVLCGVVGMTPCLEPC